MKKNDKYNTLGELYREAHLLVYKYISDFTKDGHVADDISSMIWLKVTESPSQYLIMEKTHLHNYLRRMVENTFIDQYRASKRQQSKFEKVCDNFFSSRSVEEDYILQENLNDLENARQSLSKEEQKLLYLRFDEELSARTIAMQLGISEGAVRVKQHRILVKLKKKMNEMK